MADETARAVNPAPSPQKSEFGNVEFLNSSLSDPLNVLRAKLKELSELPDSVLARRVIIITDLISDEGRGLDVIWNESDDESSFNVQDSIISMLARVNNIITGSGD